VTVVTFQDPRGSPATQTTDVAGQVRQTLWHGVPSGLSAPPDLTHLCHIWHSRAMAAAVRQGMPLRERKTQALREAVLDILLERVKGEGFDDIAMEDLARSAGVSRRTLYRLFPTREALLAAAGARFADTVGMTDEIGGPDELSATFREASRLMERRADLARALYRSTVGRGIRAGQRSRRIKVIENVLRPLTAELDEDEARRVTAVIAFLISSNTWITIQDDSGLDGDEIRLGVSWAIDLLVDDLKRRTRRRKHDR
jgi:AcrR family transcriptional regulator